jgi:hypothetical protein
VFGNSLPSNVLGALAAISVLFPATSNTAKVLLRKERVRDIANRAIYSHTNSTTKSNQNHEEKGVPEIGMPSFFHTTNNWMLISLDYQLSLLVSTYYLNVVFLLLTKNKTLPANSNINPVSKMLKLFVAVFGSS